MARPPKPWYVRGARRTDFGGIRNRVLVEGPNDAATKLQAEKELLRLREQHRMLGAHPSMETPIAVVVERFLDEYEDRVVYLDYCNELNWFMGAEPPGATFGRKNRRGENRPSGGRFGFDCKDWPIRKLNAKLVETYLQRRKKAGLGGFHPYVALKCLMNWARKKGYIPMHDLDLVSPALRRRGRRTFLPRNEEVFKAINGADGRFKDVIMMLMMTGMRPKEVITVKVGELDNHRRQLVIVKHKVAEKVGLPKVVPLPTDHLFQMCLRNAEGRPDDEPLFVSDRGQAWTYNAIRIRWQKLRDGLGLEKQFTLYCFRHWYLTMGVESGEQALELSQLAGQFDAKSLEFYVRISNGRRHEVSGRIAETIERVGRLCVAPGGPPTSTVEEAVEG